MTDTVQTTFEETGIVFNTLIHCTTTAMLLEFYAGSIAYLSVQLRAAVLAVI